MVKSPFLFSTLFFSIGGGCSCHRSHGSQIKLTIFNVVTGLFGTKPQFRVPLQSLGKLPAQGGVVLIQSSLSLWWIVVIPAMTHPSVLILPLLELSGRTIQSNQHPDRPWGCRSPYLWSPLPSNGLLVSVFMSAYFFHEPQLRSQPEIPFQWPPFDKGTKVACACLCLLPGQTFTC